jgi:hypothetical protein
VLGGTARHLLLMTATPHSSTEEDFQLFMALLIRIASRARPATAYAREQSEHGGPLPFRRRQLDRHPCAVVHLGRSAPRLKVTAAALGYRAG